MSEASREPKVLHPGVKLALELGPLAVFFLGTSFFDFFIATGAFMSALDRKSTRLNSSHVSESRMPSSA